MGSRFDYDEETSIIAVIRSLVARHGPDSKIEVVPIGMNALRRLVAEWDAQPAQQVRAARPTANVRVLGRQLDQLRETGDTGLTRTVSMPGFKLRELLDYIETLEENVAAHA